MVRGGRRRTAVAISVTQSLLSGSGGCGRIGFDASELTDATVLADAQVAGTDGRVGGCAAGTYYRDQDQDGYGGADGVACAPSVGFVAIGGDCDDSSGFVYPGAREFCDGADDDCNLMVDDAAGCPAGAEGHLGFGGKPYLRLATPLPYSTAVQTCLDAGMYLVRVESQEEHDYLWSIAGNLTTFIGATDSAGGGNVVVVQQRRCVLEWQRKRRVCWWLLQQLDAGSRAERHDR
jgi:hypothetical protein